MRIIIVGSRGQDGKILCELFAQKNCKIIGIHSNGLDCINTEWSENVSIENPESIENLIKYFKPDQIYYLAAYHQSAEKRLTDGNDLITKSFNVNVTGYAYFLEAVKNHSPLTRVFYAASSHVFADTCISPQTEETMFAPNSIYGITKVAGIMLSRLYRNNFGLIISSGIFYNHESKYRQNDFLSAKIINGAYQIKAGKADQLTLGNIDVKVDWGYAGDYMEAVIGLLEAGKSDEYIIASGKNHTVKEFVELVFKYFDLDWEKYVISGSGNSNQKNAELLGNIDKIEKEIGWKPKTNFPDMIEKLVKEKNVSKPGVCNQGGCLNE